MQRVLECGVRLVGADINGDVVVGIHQNKDSFLKVTEESGRKRTWENENKLMDERRRVKNNLMADGPILAISVHWSEVELYTRAQEQEESHGELLCCE